MPRPFVPTPDTAALLNRLLDIYERRGGEPKQVVRVALENCLDALPGYFSQMDPAPRVKTNEQLDDLAQRAWLDLDWQYGQEHHLLESVSLATREVTPLYELVERVPLAQRRARLRTLLLGNRFRLRGWCSKVVSYTLAKLDDHQSPTPFDLMDDAWNQDLLEALAALPQDSTDAVPYRVFSVRVFNDSKRFDALKSAVARLARRHNAEWRALSYHETLRELGLVPNPDHVYLYGPWHLRYAGHAPVGNQAGEHDIALAPFYPSAGLPASLVSRVTQAHVAASRVICVENLTPFYELIQHEAQDLAALCLWGNPSPACRHLLRHLAESLPSEVPLLLWADIDYGGLNILGHLRRYVAPRFMPYRMDIPTLEAYAYWGQPLTTTDRRNLTRLRGHPLLADMEELIDVMLDRELKLEQEAIILREIVGGARNR